MVELLVRVLKEIESSRVALCIQRKNKAGFTDPMKIKASVVAVYKKGFKPAFKEKKKFDTYNSKWK